MNRTGEAKEEAPGGGGMQGRRRGGGRRQRKAGGKVGSKREGRRGSPGKGSQAGRERTCPRLTPHWLSVRASWRHSRVKQGPLSSPSAGTHASIRGVLCSPFPQSGLPRPRYPLQPLTPFPPLRSVRGLDWRDIEVCVRDPQVPLHPSLWGSLKGQGLREELLRVWASCATAGTSGDLETSSSSGGSVCNRNYSSTDLTWMRLVQAACSSKEQNLEAYLENSQLYYCPTKKISQNEELFVWYDKELSCLLGFQDIKARALQKDYRCPECNHTFKCEHSFLSHICFLCSPGKASLVMSFPDPKAPHTRDLDQSTNFHNLARDLEVKMATQKDTLHSPLSERRTQTNDAEQSQVQKIVLLEKTSHLKKGLPSVPYSREDGGTEHVLSAAIWKLSPVKQSSKKPPWDQKPSAFTEVKRLKDKLRSERAREGHRGSGSEQLGKEQQPIDCVLSGAGSAFSFVWPARALGELGSAFSKPVKCLAQKTALSSQLPVSNSAEALGDLSGFINTMDAMCCGNLLNSKFLISDLCNLQMLQEWAPQCNTFPYASELWPKPVAQLHISPSSASSTPSSPSLTLLPPTFTSLGMATQNWCAKCNLSFRMTSDLVFHMRSHHKKEYSSSEVEAKRRREEKLTCPICHEYFRERHHLSRHMTSHN